MPWGEYPSHQTVANLRGGSPCFAGEWNQVDRRTQLEKPSRLVQTFGGAGWRRGCAVFAFHVLKLGINSRAGRMKAGAKSVSKKYLAATKISWMGNGRTFTTPRARTPHGMGRGPTCCCRSMAQCTIWRFRRHMHLFSEASSTVNAVGRWRACKIRVRDAGFSQKMHRNSNLHRVFEPLM